MAIVRQCDSCSAIEGDDVVITPVVLCDWYDKDYGIDSTGSQLLRGHLCGDCLRRVKAMLVAVDD